jgi:ankyrin repeat protein
MPVFVFHRQFLIAIVALSAALNGGCDMVKGEKPASAYFSDALEADLVRAAVGGQATEVRRLVSVGARVNAIGKDHMTPLVLALLAGNTEGVRALLQQGADPNQRTGPDKNDHPVWWAAGLTPPAQMLTLFL